MLSSKRMLCSCSIQDLDSNVVLLTLHLDFYPVLLQTILVGNVCQWIIKPLLGLILALTLVPLLGLPHAVGTGIILVCPTPFYLAVVNFLIKHVQVEEHGGNTFMIAKTSCRAQRHYEL